MQRNIQILPYIPAYKNTLMAILQSNVPLYFHPTEIPLYESFLDRNEGNYFVICHEKTIIGAGGIYTIEEGKIGALSWGFLQANYHYKGFGKTLLAYRIQALKAIPSVEKIIVKTSQLAYGFFEKNGFILQSIIKDYWAPNMHLYEMLYIEQ